MEHHDVTGLVRERDDVEGVAVGLDVRQPRPLRLGVERLGLVVRVEGDAGVERPAVAAPHELQRLVGGHPVERDPEPAHVLAVRDPRRRVLVPRASAASGRRTSARPARRTATAPRCPGSRRRRRRWGSPAGASGTQGWCRSCSSRGRSPLGAGEHLGRVRPGGGEVALEAELGERHPLGVEQLRQVDHAVVAEGLLHRCCRRRPIGHVVPLPGPLLAGASGGWRARLRKVRRYRGSGWSGASSSLDDAPTGGRPYRQFVPSPRGWSMASGERSRVEGFGQLENGLRQASEWYLWGPYLSERQWGTVREDYSEDGDAWSYLPHDHARSRAYRWGEDGMAGFSDVEQRLCLGLALWNGRDPILKERMFGLTGAQANHGEDVKEYWWYLDALPSHAWNRWRYHYPQAAFPYDDLIAENGRRGKLDPEYELLDTGAFDDDRYWIVEVDYVKADPLDLLMVVRVTNAGPAADTLHVLPTVWFRNTWSWDVDAPKPGLRAARRRRGRDRPSVPRRRCGWSPAPARTARRRPRCSARTRPTSSASTASAATTPYPKDGINDHVVHGRGHGEPRSAGDEGGLLAPAGRRARRDRRAAAAAASGWRRAGRRSRRARRRLRRGRPPPPGRGRRVLRRADATRHLGRRRDGDATGLRRDAVEQAAVRLRRLALAGR